MANYLELVKAIGPYVSAAGEIAGKVGANRAAGRASENTAAGVYDRTAVDSYTAEQNAKFQAAKLLEDATQDRADRFLTDSQKRAQQVVLGDLMANTQDVDIGGLPSYIPHMSFSGGLRPSALGANARQAGRSLSQQALEAQLSGSDIPNLPDMTGLGKDAPGLTPLQQSGKLDTLLAVLGTAGLGAGTLAEIQKQKDAGKVNQLVNRRMPLTQGGMTIPTASAGGMTAKPTTIALLNRAAGSGGGYTGD